MEEGRAVGRNDDDVMRDLRKRRDFTIGDRRHLVVLRDGIFRQFASGALARRPTFDQSNIVGVFDKFLVDPVAPVVPAPDFSANKPAGNRSPWKDDGPKMPDFRPGRLCTQAQQLKTVATV